MRRVVLTLVGLAAAGLVLAGLVIGLGLYNVSAARGHLPGVSWVLHTTYRNSVRLRAPSEEAVPALTGDMAEIGARHFESACRMCHSPPGEQRTATVRSMVPPPPPIRDAVAGWEPRHLFWIALNGVKMSGMPHWPAPRREDEAWMMAAFLDRVRDMSPGEYAALVAPPEGAEDGLVAYCATCHGLDGAGRGNGRMPRLDILEAPYIAASLEAFRDGLRFSGVMQHAASQLSGEQIAALARRFGRAEPAPAPASQPDPQVEAGRRLALGAPAGRDTPACRACHGPWPARRAPLFPTLVGQRAAYIADQLRLWKAGHRGGTERAHVMNQVAHAIRTEADAAALAAYYAAGAPAGPAAATTSPAALPAN